MQKCIKFVSSFEHINFAINGKYSKRNYDNPNYYVSFDDFSNIKKCEFKDCPFTGVVPLIVILPIGFTILKDSYLVFLANFLYNF
jgi:hypothetical protein